jgi:hypothetical protein
MSDQPAAPEAAEESQAKKSPGLIGRLKIPLLILAIVIVEGVVVYLLMPSAADTKVMAMAIEPHEEPKEELHDLPMGESGHGGHGEDFAEVELGEFTITVARLEKNVTRNVSFQLFGGVPADEKEEFTHHFEGVKHRICDDIDTIVRGADEAALSDPGLSLIKRRILDNTNRSLGKPYLKGVYLNEFTYVEL